MSVALEAAEELLASAVEMLARMVRRAVVNSTSATYFMQLTGFRIAGAQPETFEAVELWQHFGHTSRPPAGCEAALVKPDADAEQALCVATADRANRPTDLADGDSVLYGKKSGSDQARVNARADLDIDAVPGPSAHVNVGAAKGDGALEAALLGDAMIAKLDALSTAVGLLTTASDLATVITLANGLKAALATFSASASALAAARVKVK